MTLRSYPMAIAARWGSAPYRLPGGMWVRRGRAVCPKPPPME